MQEVGGPAPATVGGSHLPSPKYSSLQKMDFLKPCLLYTKNACEFTSLGTGSQADRAPGGEKKLPALCDNLSIAGGGGWV